MLACVVLQLLLGQLEEDQEDEHGQEGRADDAEVWVPARLSEEADDQGSDDEDEYDEGAAAHDAEDEVLVGNSPILCCSYVECKRQD